MSIDGSTSYWGGSVAPARPLESGQDGRIEAFSQVFQRATRAARTHASRAILARHILPDEREDVIQEVFLGLWQELPNFDQNKASLPTFVERVIQTRTTSAIRSRRALKRAMGEPLEVEPEVPGAAAAIDFRLDFYRVLRSLSPGDRKVALCLVERTPAETAWVLRMARSSIYLSIARIRDAFTAAGLDPCRRAAGLRRRRCQISFFIGHISIAQRK